MSDTKREATCPGLTALEDARVTEMEIDIDAIEARANVATAKPSFKRPQARLNERFIAHAREDVLALIAEIRKMRAAEARSEWVVRPAEGQFDEVVARNVLVHFEMMSDNALWVGITLPNGETHHIIITTRGQLTVTVEENV